MEILAYHQTGLTIPDGRVVDPEDVVFMRQYENAAIKYNASPEQYADDQANDMIVHMLGYINGDEESFSRYFVTAHEHHSMMHTKFWNKMNGLFEPPIVLDFPDKPAIKQFIFTIDDEAVLSLLARTDYSSNGTPCGVNYEAATVPRVSVKTLGSIATSVAMQ